MSVPCAWKNALTQWLSTPTVPLRLRPPIEVGQLAAALAASGLESAIVELAEADGKAAMMQAFQRDLDWPGWFGANWDALADLLMGAEDPAARPRVLILSGWSSFAACTPDTASTLLEVIEEVSAEANSLLFGVILLTKE